MSNRYVTSSFARVCVALGGAVLISAVFVLVLGLPTGLPRWCDFRIYYAAAHTYFVDAGNPYLVDRPFPFVYSYLWLWLLRPLLAVSLDTAAVIVLGIAVVMLFMTMVLIARATHIDELPSKQLAM